MMDMIKGSLRPLARKKLRTTLTVLSIAIAVASVVLISSIVEIGRQTVFQELQSLGLDGIAIGRVRQNVQSPLGVGEVERVRQTPGVQAAIGINASLVELRMRSLVANGMAFGVDESAPEFISMELEHGRLLNRRDIDQRSKVCVIDQNVAQAFYKRDNIVGKEIQIVLGTSVQKFTIVGVVRSGGNVLQGLMTDYIPSFVYLPYTTMQQYTMKNHFDQIAVKLQPDAGTSQVSQRLIHVLEQKNGIRNGYQAQDITSQKETLDRMLETITLVLSLIAGISLVVAGLGIMTMMMVSVHERTHEIGIKKSIGASRGMILLEFLIEAFTVTLLGGMIGAAAGTILVAAGCILLKVQVNINAFTVLGSILFSILVGVIFGVYPASVAAGLRPVEALKN